ncbi:MAG: TRZ/ATZ family hydrolase [Burkholderiaceae bacterium]|jgi:5-methylthioadenosine/S-adenosylhomocysteine deaminase
MKTLIVPRWLLSMQDPVHIQEGMAVLLNGEKIAAIGSSEHLLHQYPDARRIDRPDHVLMPGLINAHAHAAMNLLRGVGDDLPLMEWLQKRIWPLESALVDEQFVYDGTVLACAEMLLGGITTFSDMYFFPGAAVRAALAMGNRIVAGATVLEFPTRYANDARDYLNKGLAARDLTLGESRVHWSLAPHAPYTVSDEIFREIAVLAEQLDLPIHTHVHETLSEVEDGIARHGCRPLARLKRLGLLTERLIAVHAVHLNGDDIDDLAHAGANIVHCPASNLKLASGFSPVAQASTKGVNVALGTDGAASNNRLDLWADARLAALLAKAVANDATAFSARQTLSALTRDAACALGLEHKIGQVRNGFAADLICIEIPLDSFNQPAPDVLSHLIYVGDRKNVSDVWVAGQQVVQMRQLRPEASSLLTEILRNCDALWQTRTREALGSGISLAN